MFLNVCGELCSGVGFRTGHEKRSSRRKRRVTREYLKASDTSNRQQRGRGGDTGELETAGENDDVVAEDERKEDQRQVGSLYFALKVHSLIHSLNNISLSTYLDIFIIQIPWPDTHLFLLTLHPFPMGVSSFTRQGFNIAVLRLSPLYVA